VKKCCLKSVLLNRFFLISASVSQCASRIIQLKETVKIYRRLSVDNFVNFEDCDRYLLAYNDHYQAFASVVYNCDILFLISEII